MHPEIVDAVVADLADFQSDSEDPGVREGLLRLAQARFLRTIDLIPEPLRGGDILQLGSEPYLLSVCLRRACTGRLTMANYFGTDARRGEQVLVNRRTGEHVRLEYDHFDVETDDFPYPDASFDVVMFCEILEHLVLDPVRALSDIHRVLRPDGVVVLTTPNCLALMRLEGFLSGRSEIVDRYSPAFGAGARHNREYRPYEVRELLERTGFVVEEMAVRDVIDVPPAQRRRRALWKRFLRWYSDHPHEDHIFVRARRGPRFRWSFPENLFDHIEFYLLVKYPWIEMGVNDSIQCTFASWSPLDPGADGGGARRWTRGAAQALLRSPGGSRAAHLECFAPAASGAAALPVRVIVRHRLRWPDDPSLTYADQVFDVARGSWQTLTATLRASPPAGEEVEVNIAPDPTAVAAPALGALPERERGLAVRRVWLD